MSNTGTEWPAASRPTFATTHWSEVLAAGHNDIPNAQAALEHLCQSYWHPIYLRLEQELAREGKAALFAALRVTLTEPRGATPYADLARQTGLSEGAVRVAAHRLRRRYRQLLRTAIHETVSAPDEVEDELRYLLAFGAD